MASTPSFNIGGLSLKDAYQRLDEEIAQLQDHLMSLRTLRNSLAPISNLSVELISEIFLHIHSQRDRPAKRTDLRSRFRVSWVCRHWRDIALTTPSLWTTISKVNKTAVLRSDCVRELLIRSRGMGLTVNLCEPSHDALEIFLAHMSRVEHFRLKYNRLQCGIQLIRPAPVLVSLELINIVLPSSLIFEDYPYLRHLSMDNVPFTKFHFPCHLIQSLTTLRIIESGPVQVGELVNILPSLPHLLHLELVRSLSLENIRPPLQHLPLPSLRAICFVDEVDEIVHDFLRCFDIPQVAVTIAWSAKLGYEMTEPHMDYLRASINSFLQEAEIPIRHLGIRRDDPDYTIDISSSPSQHRYSFDFSHQLNCDTTKWLHLLIPSHIIETLDINDLPRDALKIIMDAPDLKRVITSGVDATQTLIEALGQVPSGNSLSLPSLKELMVHGVDFGSHGTEALGDILANRHEVGSGLEKLVFMECMNVGIDSFKGFVKVTKVV